MFTQEFGAGSTQLPAALSQAPRGQGPGLPPLGLQLAGATWAPREHRLQDTKHRSGDCGDTWELTSRSLTLSVIRAPAENSPPSSFPYCVRKPHHRLVLHPGMNVSPFLQLKNLKSVLLQGALPDLTPFTPPGGSSALTHSLCTTLRSHTPFSTEGGRGVRHGGYRE